MDTRSELFGLIGGLVALALLPLIVVTKVVEFVVNAPFAIVRAIVIHCNQR